MSFSSRNYIFFLLARLLFGTKWGYFIVELIFFFWNINSTIISWLIYTFSSQLNTFCILHVIPYFHKGKVHNLNYHPLQYFCMLGFLGYEMCLKVVCWRIYWYFWRFFFSFFPYLFDLESKMEVVLPHHLIHITAQLLVHILHFCPLLSWLEEGLLFPL